MFKLIHSHQHLRCIDFKTKAAWITCCSTFGSLRNDFSKCACIMLKCAHVCVFTELQVQVQTTFWKTENIPNKHI